MRVFSRFRRADPPPPPYALADPSAAHAQHADLVQSLAAPAWPQRPPGRTERRPRERRPRERRKGLAALPLSVLHRVCELALAVPAGWDEDADAARARWALYQLRGVDRRFFIVVTALLRARVLPAYAARVTESSDPVAPGSGAATAESVFAHRSREGAVLDRFLALRAGFEMRAAESSLTEAGGEEDHLFAFLQLRKHWWTLTLQPAARIEDLLLSLPPHLVTPARPHAALAQGFPLPHGHVSVSLSSRWVQLFLHYAPYGRRSTGRALVVEMRRQRSAEATVARLGIVLDAVRAGRIPWGSTRVE